MLGHIVDYDGECLTIVVPDFFDVDLLSRQDIRDCDVTLLDGRTISPRQNRAIHSMVRDITAYVSGYSEKESARSEMLRVLQSIYLMDVASGQDNIRYALTEHFCELRDTELFSLSAKSQNAASMSLARDFLTWLIDFALEHAIPCSGKLIDRAEDIQRYIYACVMHKRCIACGCDAELHHAEDRVGMGRDRKNIIHTGMSVQPLCRKHHTEVHTIGQASFNAKHHVESIKCDEEVCKKYGLKYEVE